MFYIIYTQGNNEIGSQAVNELLSRKLGVSLFSLNTLFEEIEHHGCFVDDAGVEDLESHVNHLIRKNETGVVDGKGYPLSQEMIECVNTYGGELVYITIGPNQYDLIESWVEDSEYELDHDSIVHDDLIPFYVFGKDVHIDEQIDECLYKLKKHIALRE